MSIDFFIASDGMHVRQSFVSPTVYLDHWAIRLLSDNLSLQNRFVSALKSKSGTLLLSTFSLMEFSGASDPKHCLDAEIFFDRILPNIYFTDFAFDKVNERENAENDNVKRFWPPADLPTLKFIAEYASNDFKNMTTRGIVELSHENRDALLKLKTKISCGVRGILDSYRNDDLYVSKARKALPSNQRTRIFVILGELLRGFTLDSNSNLTDNDVIDLVHAILPLNCCDYILLDGAWNERVKKMEKRLKNTAVYMPVAKCFSGRDNGMELFLSDLEKFDKADQMQGVACP